MHRIVRLRNQTFLNRLCSQSQFAFYNWTSYFYTLTESIHSLPRHVGLSLSLSWLSLWSIHALRRPRLWLGCARLTILHLVVASLWTRPLIQVQVGWAPSFVLLPFSDIWFYRSPWLSLGQTWYFSSSKIIEEGFRAQQTSSDGPGRLWCSCSDTCSQKVLVLF